MNTVSATTIAGGFPGSLDPFDNKNGNDYTTVELHTSSASPRWFGE
jgi:hypothetical protein